MSMDKEIAFVIFFKSIYEVRPKKHPKNNKTHHWKLRIETLKSQESIKRVEFILHDTFPEPRQTKKKAPFEIEEEGFGNFELQIVIKILNRKIPLPYFIELHPHKVTTIQFHHSVWMVKPKELSKVLEIGGVPIENFDNGGPEEMAALTKILEYVKRHNDKPLDPSQFYPRVYEKVIQKIRRFESSEMSSSLIYNPENDVGQSDDSSSTRKSHNPKPQNVNKHNIFDPRFNEKPKMKIPKAVSEFVPSPKMSDSQKDYIFKKEMKRKKTNYDSSSESDTDNTFNLHKKNRKPDNFNKMTKHDEIKTEKSVLNRPVEKKPDAIMKVESSLKPVSKQLLPSKSKSIEKSNTKPSKDQNKSKLKIKDNNPDSFSKLFDSQDILVVNRNKQNIQKVKDEPNIKRVKQEINVKNNERKHSTPVKVPKEISSERTKKKIELFGDDSLSKKSKPIKHEEKTKTFMKEIRPVNKTNPLVNDLNSKQSLSGNKMKLPEKTMPEQKKSRDNETGKVAAHKLKKPNQNVYPRTLSRSTSSGSDQGSAFSKSSSDNEIDHDMFKPKKKVEMSSSDQAKYAVRQLFGDDKSDGSDDDDDQNDNISDIFSSLKNSSKKHNNKSQSKHHSSPHGKSDEENSSDNEALHNKDSISRSQSPDIIKSETQLMSNTESINKGISDIQQTSSLCHRERKRLAKQLIKINDKDFFEKLQRLLLISFRNNEKSLKFDSETMKLDFHMGEISDGLANNIKSMVDEYVKAHQSSNPNSNMGF